MSNLFHPQLTLNATATDRFWLIGSANDHGLSCEQLRRCITY